MNYIWGGLIVISIIFGTITGRLDDVVNAMLTSVKNAVEIALALAGIMAFWLGMVKIAQKTGLVSGFAKLISPLLRLVFNELPKNSPAFSNIALNFSANALGLANAATPFGIKAMQDLKQEAQNAGGKQDTASNSMCIFLGMNTAGFQLIPASVIAILIAARAKNPTEIILPTLIVTSIAFIFAIIIARALAPLFSKKRSIDKDFDKLKKKASKTVQKKSTAPKQKLKQKFSAKSIDSLEYKPQLQNLNPPQFDFREPEYEIPTKQQEHSEQTQKLKKLKRKRGL